MACGSLRVRRVRRSGGEGVPVGAGGASLPGPPGSRAGNSSSSSSSSRLPRDHPPCGRPAAGSLVGGCLAEQSQSRQQLPGRRPARCIRAPAGMLRPYRLRWPIGTCRHRYWLRMCARRRRRRSSSGRATAQPGSRPAAPRPYRPLGMW